MLAETGGNYMTFFDYGLTDLLFSHWLKRKRELLPGPVPEWLNDRLDQLRPIRNPNCSAFVLDEGPLYSV